MYLDEKAVEGLQHLDDIRSSLRPSSCTEEVEEEGEDEGRRRCLVCRRPARFSCER
jgi:hypothetical protein